MSATQHCTTCGLYSEEIPVRLHESQSRLIDEGLTPTACVQEGKLNGLIWVLTQAYQAVYKHVRLLALRLEWRNASDDE